MLRTWPMHVMAFYLIDKFKWRIMYMLITYILYLNVSESTIITNTYVYMKIDMHDVCMAYMSLFIYTYIYVCIFVCRLPGMSGHLSSSSMHKSPHMYVWI